MHIDQLLPDEVKHFRSTYCERTGGYLVPPREQMARLTSERAQHYKVKYFNQPMYDSVEREVAELLYVLASNIGATRIVETGCSRGFSTCYLAASVWSKVDGMVISIDPARIPHLWDGTHLEKAIKWLPEKSDEVKPVVMDLLGGDKADMLFLDSLHTYDNLLGEIIEYETLLKDGGIIVLHDTMFYDSLAYVVEAVRENPRFEVCNIPTPRTHGIVSERCPGVTICRKINSDRKKFPLILNNELIKEIGDKEIVSLYGRSDTDAPLLNKLETPSLILKSQRSKADKPSAKTG